MSLRELAHEAVVLVSGHIAERGVEVTILPGLPVVLGDRVRLTEVFQSLIANAVKYMGGQTNPRIEIGSRSADAEVVCFVRDNGMGIDPQYHERVFRLFEQLDPSKEGTGIGLALVKRIVEVHGGGSGWSRRVQGRAARSILSYLRVWGIPRRNRPSPDQP